MSSTSVGARSSGATCTRSTWLRNRAQRSRVATVRSTLGASGERKNAMYEEETPCATTRPSPRGDRRASSSRAHRPTWSRPGPLIEVNEAMRAEVAGPLTAAQPMIEPQS